MIITLDIETIGDDSAETREAIAETIKHPGNMKKAETIEKWEAEEKTGLIDEAVEKTSFDGALGHIVCIGYAVDDAEPITCCEPDEISNLMLFYNDIQKVTAVASRSGEIDAQVTFVGHNISGFDLRFLYHRSIILGIRPPGCIMQAIKAKPWDSCIANTMLMWSPERERRISLDRLCKALGIKTPKGDMDGSKVWEYYRAGRYQEIAEYCKRDVAATRAVYKRLIFA